MPPPSHGDIIVSAQINPALRHVASGLNKGRTHIANNSTRGNSNSRACEHRPRAWREMPFGERKSLHSIKYWGRASCSFSDTSENRLKGIFSVIAARLLKANNGIKASNLENGVKAAERCHWLLIYREISIRALILNYDCGVFIIVPGSGGAENLLSGKYDTAIEIKINIRQRSRSGIERGVSVR